MHLSSALLTYVLRFFPLHIRRLAVSAGRGRVARIEIEGRWRKVRKVEGRG